LHAPHCRGAGEGLNVGLVGSGLGLGVGSGLGSAECVGRAEGTGEGLREAWGGAGTVNVKLVLEAKSQSEEPTRVVPSRL